MVIALKTDTSDLVPPSVQCAYTGIGPCERICWVPASATLCLQRRYRVRNESACGKTKENRRRRHGTSVPSARFRDSSECVSDQHGNLRSGSRGEAKYVREGLQQRVDRE